MAKSKRGPKAQLHEEDWTFKPETYINLKKNCQCPNHNCDNSATGNHYIQITIPVCRECFVEDMEDNE